ncbi:MAG TPA: lamin tail domain-containing protein, partial [Chromatiales bacterium]|nr:lamin tail domain-containing protein [Chromatiales bacterium]
MLFADRIHRFLFNGGVLTPESLIPRYERLSGEVELAIIGESARWGDEHHSTPLTLEDWYDGDERYNDGRAGQGWILNYYLPQRTDIVLQQFRNAGLYPSVDAPVFYVDGQYQHGGAVPSGAQLSMRDADGTIWYTLDGSDPRVPARAASSGDDSLLVAEDAAKRVLIPLVPVDPAWRSSATFDDSSWISGVGGVGYERSTGYEPFFDVDVTDQMYGRSTSCYIRIPFDVTPESLADLPALTLDVRYDDGFVAYLNGVEIARRNFDGDPIWTSAAVAQNSDLNAVEFEEIDVSDYLDELRPGRNLLAVHALNISTTSSDFLFSATLAGFQSTGGSTGGAVSAKASQYAGPFAPARSVRVLARSLQGTSWSALNEAVFGVGPVAEFLRISEVMYHPLDPNAEYVELTNIGSETIDLNLVAFTDGIDFAFPSVELAPGAYALVVRDRAAFEAVYGQELNVAGQYAGSLNDAGEELELQDATGQVIERFDYEDNWYDITDGVGFSLTVKDPSATRADGF